MIDNVYYSLLLEFIKKQHLQTCVFPPSIQNNYNIILDLIKYDTRYLQYASKELIGYREVVLVAVQKYGIALEFASEELRGDIEVVLAAVHSRGEAFEFASEELKGDREVVLAAVKQYPFALEHASEELKKDKLFLIECYRLNKNISTFNNFIKEFDNLENGIFNDSFIIENKDIINLIENKQKLYEYLVKKEIFSDIIWENNKDEIIPHIINLALRR